MRSVGRYALPVTLMVVIFALSAQSSLPRVGSDVDLVLRKAAHMTEFGLLWTLWRRALPGAPARTALLALGVTLAYAVSDEVHQAFVPGRHPSPFDVAIDLAGVGVAAAWWLGHVRWGRSRRVGAASVTS